MRSFPVGEYVILYRIEQGDVLILHVARAAGTWKDCLASLWQGYFWLAARLALKVA